MLPVGARAALVHTSENVAYADHNKVRGMTYFARHAEDKPPRLETWNGN